MIFLVFENKNKMYDEKMYDEVKDETGIILIPHVLEGIMSNPALMSDMIHPNSKGYELVADKFYEKIFEGLQKAPPPPSSPCLKTDSPHLYF